MNKYILHIDFDSFFASVDQQCHPEFRNKPLGVLAANGRTAIIAASKEAKALGVSGRDRTYRAIEKCPWIQFTKADFRNYFEVSKKFLKIASSFSPTVEMFSIDEVFMDVTGTAKHFGGVYSLIRLIKQRIGAEIGEYITVSVGLSHNKLLAKLASGLNKPDGFCEINENNIWDVYKRAEITDICGIGFRIAKRLNCMGIYNLLQLRDASLNDLISEFGQVEGRFLKNVGLGIDYSEVIPYTKAPQAKSVSRNYCLPHNEYDQRIVYQNIFELCEEVALKLRRLNKKTQHVGLYLRGDKNFGGYKRIDGFLDSGQELYALCSLLFAKWNFSYVRMISVWAGSLHDSQGVPQSLFAFENRKTKLQQTIDIINDKFGDHTIRNGFLLYADKLTTVPNGFGSDRLERMKLAE